MVEEKKTREQMIEDIQKEISDKSLTFGCRIKHRNYTIAKYPIYVEGTITSTLDRTGPGACGQDRYMGLFTVFYECEHGRYDVGRGKKEGPESVEVVILGHPITLGRILYKLNANGGNSYSLVYNNTYINKRWEIVEIPYIDTSELGFYEICEWKLANEDGSDAILDDQSYETIESLHKILVRK